jgi:hypothetical protein
MRTSTRTGAKTVPRIYMDYSDQRTSDATSADRQAMRALGRSSAHGNNMESSGTQKDLSYNQEAEGIWL